MKKKLLLSSLSLVLFTSLPVLGFRANTPAQAAQALFSAWQNNDRTAASKVALPAAVKWIFEMDRDVQYKFENCNRQGSTWHCFYRETENGGAVNMTMVKVGKTYKVKSIAYYLN